MRLFSTFILLLLHVFTTVFAPIPPEEGTEDPSGLVWLEANEGNIEKIMNKNKLVDNICRCLKCNDAGSPMLGRVSSAKKILKLISNSFFNFFFSFSPAAVVAFNCTQTRILWWFETTFRSFPTRKAFFFAGDQKLPTTGSGASRKFPSMGPSVRCPTMFTLLEWRTQMTKDRRKNTALPFGQR